MESYWEQAARGAMPQNGGWNSVVNPLANSGQPINLNALVPQQRSSQMGPAYDAALASNLQYAAGRRQQTARDRVVKQARDAQVAQQTAQKSRLDEAVAGYKERRVRANQAFDNAGAANVAAINRQYDQLVARTRTDMGASGLGQTTALTSALSGIERDRAAALAQANTQGAQASTAVDLQTSGDYLDFLGNIQDNFDPGPLVDLSRAEGQATQNQLDPNAFGGNFFSAGVPAIGGAGYGADFGMYSPLDVYPQAGPQAAAQQGGWSDPFGTGAAPQQPQLSVADQNRLKSYQTTRNQQAFQKIRGRIASDTMQQKAMQRIAGGNHFQYADYGPDAPLYAPR